MRSATLLAVANLGTAFAAVQIYGQCGGGAFTGETECAEGSSCVAQNEWYSQCIPGGGSSGSAPPAQEVEVPESPEAPAPEVSSVEEEEEEENNNNNDETAPVESVAPVVPSQPAEEGEGEAPAPIETPSPAAPSQPAEEGDNEPSPVEPSSVAAAPTAGSGSGSGSGSGGITRTIPASSGSTNAATAIPVSGELDGGMMYYDRSRKTPQYHVSSIYNLFS